MRDFQFQSQQFIKCPPAGKSASRLIKMAVPAKLQSVIVRSESKGMPLDEDSSERGAKIRWYHNCISTNSSSTLLNREDQAGLTGLYESDPEAEGRAPFGSHSNYNDMSSDDSSVTYRNNSPSWILKKFSQYWCSVTFCFDLW